MTKRIGISEAPLATLGEVDTTQHIPIVQADNDGKNEARRSTIANMRNYFTPAPIPVQPISQIGSAVTGNQTIVVPGGIASGETFNIGPLRFQESTIRDLTSTTGNLSLFDNFVFVTAGGTYKISIRVQVIYFSTRQVVSFRWLGGLEVEINGETQRFNGYFIRPAPPSTSPEYTIGEIETLVNIPAGAGIQVRLTLTNCGTTTSPTAGAEVMNITAIDASHPTIMTVQRMAE